MCAEKQNTPYFLTRIGFLILVFFCICAFSSDSESKFSNSKLEIVTALNIKGKDVSLVKVVQLPAYQKDWITYVERAHLKFSAVKNLLSSCNCKNFEKYKSLQLLQFEIVPKLVAKFYYLLFTTDFIEYPAN